MSISTQSSHTKTPSVSYGSSPSQTAHFSSVPVAPSPKKHHFLTILFCLLTIALIVFCLSYYRIISTSWITDRIAAASYTPSADVAEIRDKIPLTDDAKTIFAASHPSLEDSTSFNEHCQSHNADVSILGCYTNSRIYIYNVQSSELNGIRESNAAHELLHAVWDRLSIFEQHSIGQEVSNFYNQHPDQIDDSIKLYSEDELVDELHSRLGTEVSNLPDSLEKHYAKYFTDRNAIVAYYQAYSTPFKQISAEFQDLNTQIDEGKATIDSMREQYAARAEELDARIDEFNSCARTQDCFTASEFNTKRAELVTAQDELEQYFYELNAKIEAYNQLIDRYNANILHNESLERAINSNSPPTEETPSS